MRQSVKRWARLRGIEPAPSPEAEATEKGSLHTQIVSEAGRFVALQAAGSVLAAVTHLVLLRLLSKRDFGVYAICLFVLGVGSLLGDGGITTTLLRGKSEPTREQLRAASSFALAVGAVASVVVLVAGGWIGARYTLTSSEVFVMRVLCVEFLLVAARVAPYVRLQRALRFGDIARIELAGTFANNALALALALAHCGVWALAAAHVATSAVQLALAYRASPGFPGFGLRWTTLGPLLGYGSKVQALGVFGFFKDNFSRSMLGVKLGPEAVGVFDFGASYIQAPLVAVNLLARVQLPVYAKLDLEDPLLYRAVRGSIRVAALLGLPALMALAVAAPWVVPTVFAPKWAPSFPVLWGLVGNMAGGLVAPSLFTLLQAQGRAGRAVGVFAGWTVVTWTLCALGLYFWPRNLGIVAAAHSVVTVAVVLGMLAWAGRLLKRSLFAPLASPALAMAAGTAAAIALGRFGPGVLRHPLAAAFGGVLAYALVLFAIDGRTVIADLRALRKPASAKPEAPASGMPSVAPSLAPEHG